MNVCRPSWNAQSVLEQSINSQMEDLVGVGFDYRATQKTSLTGEVFSDGEHDGARLGFGYRYRDNSAAYLNYVTEAWRFNARRLNPGT